MFIDQAPTSERFCNFLKAAQPGNEWQAEEGPQMDALLYGKPFLKSGGFLFVFVLM